MWPSIKFFFLIPVWLLALLLSSAALAGESRDKNWALSVYSGVFTSKNYGQTIYELPGETEDKYLQALALSRHLVHWGRHLSFELEAGFAQHFGKHQQGKQSYQEYVTALALRYHTFPWDDYLNTSLAFGQGVSFVSERPQREVQKDSESQRWLIYLLTELAVELPWSRDWEVFYRIHHRSGGFKLFSAGGSNFYCLGLRFRF